MLILHLLEFSEEQKTPVKLMTAFILSCKVCFLFIRYCAYDSILFLLYMLNTCKCKTIFFCKLCTFCFSLRRLNYKAANVSCMEATISKKNVKKVDCWWKMKFSSFFYTLSSKQDTKFDFLTRLFDTWWFFAPIL